MRTDFVIAFRRRQGAFLAFSLDLGSLRPVWWKRITRAMQALIADQRDEQN
jgi:hypothetical protein